MATYIRTLLLLLMHQSARVALSRDIHDTLSTSQIWRIGARDARKNV